MDFFIIAVAGSFGALSRYGIYLLSKNVVGSQFPWATLVINMAGCFLAGFLMGLSTSSPNKHFYSLISVGFIGSFTTFSALGVETILLLENKNIPSAILNVSLNLILGIGLIFIGRGLGRT